MKTGLLILALAAAISGGSYFAYFRCATAPTQAMLAQRGGELEWLRREFKCTDAQFAEVKKLHDEYAPKCEAMCVNVAKANQRFEQLIATNKTMTPKVEAALKECTTVQQECRQAMLGHVYAVGAKMSPEQGERYVAMMKSRIIEPALPHRAVMLASAK